MNKIGITLATAAALLTVIALVMQLSEPVSAQQQQQTTTGTIHSFCSTGYNTVCTRSATRS